MIRAYIKAAMERAHYELIDQPEEPFYGEIPELPGVMATGPTLAACQNNLEDTLDAWIVLGLQLGHEIPEIGGTHEDHGDLISDEWKAEIARRSAQMDQGEVQLIPLEQVFREADEALG